MQMQIYKEVVFKHIEQDISDIIIAELSTAGFYGFLEEDSNLKAYIEATLFDKNILDAVVSQYGVTVHIIEIPETNWNADWESSFQPVVVNDFVAIRADFHAPVQHVQHEIVITPKMSFGTGHHATTFLVLEAMQQFDWQGKEVLDFGTGTGVLAILAEKLGAENVLAIDNNQWSIENAIENCSANCCKTIQIVDAESIPEGITFDGILANINKHVLIEHCDAICKALKNTGILLLSGLLLADEEDIVNLYYTNLGEPLFVNRRNNWILIAYRINA
jgi:ribosomal protein L11 methyltransferase